MTAATKLPMSDRPMIQDMDLATAVERELAPLTGKALERAQAAVRRVVNSGAIGPFDKMLQTYRLAIREAAKGGKDDG